MYAIEFFSGSGWRRAMRADGTGRQIEWTGTATQAEQEMRAWHAAGYRVRMVERR